MSIRSLLKAWLIVCIQTYRYVIKVSQKDGGYFVMQNHCSMSLEVQGAQQTHANEHPP